MPPKRLVTQTRNGIVAISISVKINSMMNIVLLQDDFYLNLVDWSGQNILSVGLGTCVYLWSACTSQVYM